MDDMDEFLAGAAVESEPEVEEQEEAPTEEPTGETEEVEPPSTEPEPKPEPKPQVDESAAKMQAYQRAMEDERRKRQQLEQQIAQQKQAEQPKPEIWDDPDKYISEKLTAVEQKFQARILNMSEASAKSRHQDYDAKFQVFAKMVERDPSIYQNMLEQPDPAEYAYRAASRLVEIQEMGDPNSYRQKVEAEIREKVRLELESEFTEKMKNTTSLPGSFAERTSKSTPRGVGAGPASFDKIFD